MFVWPTAAISYTQDGKDLWINDLAICESGYRDITILDSNHKYSYGILQFQMATWVSYGKPFGATVENIHDKDLQHEVARSMLDQGLNYNWKTCSAKVTKKYGAYPLGVSDP